MNVIFYYPASMKTKLFCACPNDLKSYCPVCTKLPGMLPLLSERALTIAAEAGCLLGVKFCTAAFSSVRSHWGNETRYTLSNRYSPIGKDGVYEGITIKSMFLCEGVRKSNGILIYGFPYLGINCETDDIPTSAKALTALLEGHSITCGQPSVSVIADAEYCYASVSDAVSETNPYIFDADLPQQCADLSLCCIYVDAIRAQKAAEKLGIEWNKPY